MFAWAITCVLVGSALMYLTHGPGWAIPGVLIALLLVLGFKRFDGKNEKEPPHPEG